MATDMKLEDLFLDTLKDIYYAEKQIVKALPKMAKSGAGSEAEVRLRETPNRDRGTYRAPRAGIRAHRRDPEGENL